MRRHWRLVSVGLALASMAPLPACRRSEAPKTNPATATDTTQRASDPALTTTLLGGERGLDHVGVAVKDLEAATHVYRDLLGFNRPIEGKLPNGIRNVNYYFTDATYLETLVHWDRARAPWLAAFTDKRSGALFGVLSAHSPEASTTFLAARGIQASAPYLGTIELTGELTGEMTGEMTANNTQKVTAPKWHTFFLPEGTLPGDPLYFIAYPRAPREDYLRKLESRDNRRQLYHDNTALGIRALWIAVPDLAAAVRAYQSIGLGRAGAFDDGALGARVELFDTGTGSGQIWLLGAAPGKDNPVTRFVTERGGPGIMGITLLAGSIPAAARLIGERTGRPVSRFEGHYGDSFRVSPEVTLGVWLEFAQYLVPQPAP